MCTVRLRAKWLFIEQKTTYSDTRVAIPKGNAAKWLFPQEKVTSDTLFKDTITLVSL
jgi:hypothetical protein